jgi:hypothetical protein
VGAVGDPTGQVHDFEPGIQPSGLFWTIPIPPSALVVNPQRGTARLRMTDLAIPDFHDFFSAISPDPTTVPSHVSFDVRWDGGDDPSEIKDNAFDFAGRFIGGPASISFAARNDGTQVVYRSDPQGQTTANGRAAVGLERNGVFFGS